MRRAAGLPVLAAVAAFLTADVAAAQNVVLRYVGPLPPRFRAGAVVPAGTELVAGERLTLLTPQGTRELQGPQRVSGTAARGSASPSLLDGLGTQRRSRIAAVRAAPGRREAAAPPPSLWLVDVDRGGTYCLPPGLQPELWRSARTGGDVRITLDGHFAVATGRPEEPSAWPPDLPLAFGRSYETSVDGTAGSFVLRQIDAVDDSVSLRHQLVTNGCDLQAEFLAGAAAESNAG